MIDNDLLLFGKVIYSCLWWRSHYCFCSVIWTFYLFFLMFLIFFSQGLHSPFFCTCFVLRRLFLGKSSFNWPWHCLMCPVLLKIDSTTETFKHTPRNIWSAFFRSVYVLDSNPVTFIKWLHYRPLPSKFPSYFRTLSENIFLRACFCWSRNFWTADH